MLAFNTGTWGAQAQSSREWVAHRRAWSCGHRRAQVRASARSSRRGAGDLHDPWREEERRQALLKYVQEVQPQSVTQFAEQTHPVVIQAMRQTVLNVVGSLPPQYFSVRITAVAESLAQLMLSIMTTGYMLRSAQFRMELQNSLMKLPAHSGVAAVSAISASASTVASSVALPTVAAFSPTDLGTGAGEIVASAASSGDAAAQGTGGPSAAFLYDGDGSPYAPGVQKKSVEGEVLRWHLARGEVERLAAADYIELLEREVAALRAQVAQAPAVLEAAHWRPAASSATPLATAGAVEVLGPDPNAALGPSGSSSLYQSGSNQGQSQSLACVSPLPGFGERAGAGLPYGVGGLAAAAAGSAAAPATMGCGGIPLVVGSPLGLPKNELLDYLHGLQASGSGGFKELACSPSASSGQAVKEAMEMFVTRLMGTLDPEVLTKEASEFSSVELSKVLFWLMAVGYTLKSIEARLDMDDGAGGGVATAGNGGGPGPVGGSGGGGGFGFGFGSDGAKQQNGGGSRKRGGGGGLFGGLKGLLPGF